MENQSPSLPSQVEASDILLMKNYELQVEVLQLKFQAALDALWTKYEMKKGVDSLQPDGSIVRGDVRGEVK